MKQLLILLLITCRTAFAQTYQSENNIAYYSNPGTDTYKAAQCRLDIYYPKGIKNFATVLWFHGGGITQGSKEIPKALLEKGFAVIGVGYRLSPRAKAPAYIEDAAAAIAWVFKHIAQYGGSDKLIFISGHSAGAYLGLMATLDKKYLAAYGIDANQVAGVISFSAQAITHFTVRQEQGIKDTQPTIDDYAPLYHVRADAPPILLITGDRELELLGRYEENAYLMRILKLNGHKQTRLLELQGFDHGGMAESAFPLLIKEVRERTKQFMSNKM